MKIYCRGKEVLDENRVHRGAQELGKRNFNFPKTKC